MSHTKKSKYENAKTEALINLFFLSVAVNIVGIVVLVTNLSGGNNQSAFHFVLATYIYVGFCVYLLYNKKMKFIKDKIKSYFRSKT